MFTADRSVSGSSLFKITKNFRIRKIFLTFTQKSYIFLDNIVDFMLDTTTKKSVMVMKITMTGHKMLSQKIISELLRRFS